ncbi:MAG: translation elongation factor Ts [Patescibacteria group bacterium]|nr:translation elongation factor Ts [Patescibacteria group bacterium]
MKITAEKVKKLRSMTGASIMQCKKSLVVAEGNMEKAMLELRKQGETSATNKAQKETSEGIVASYVHSNNTIGALVKISCQTDFVARNEEFQQLAKDITMQIAATNPKYLSPEDIPASVLEKEKSVEEKVLKGSSKPKDVIKKIIDNKLEKFKKENSLLTQDFIKNPEITIEDLIKEKISKLGENIKVTDFSRLEIIKK